MFPFVRQRDSMQCGVASLAMVCRHYGMPVTLAELDRRCSATAAGMSMHGLRRAAASVGLSAVVTRLSAGQLRQATLPAILHWDQRHFTVLYRVSNGGRRYHVADPAKGRISYSREEFCRHWVSTTADGDERGVAMLLEPSGDRPDAASTAGTPTTGHSVKFLLKYMRGYRRHFIHILLGLLLGCALQLVMPFLTQSIVDVGIRHEDIGFIWLVLIGELMIVVGRAATDFIRRWLLLHVSMRVNISLVSDFFIKLLRLPMSFFDTKLTGDLLQRMDDHRRVQEFLTGQLLGIVFALLSFAVFGIVLLIYDRVIFAVFMAGSAIYAGWLTLFLRRRKVIDYELFEQQAISRNKTFRFITAMQEIKLQDCERRRRWEWEDSQAGLFGVQMRSLRLQQGQEAGSIFINEVKNIVITVLAATAVIDGQMTLGAMLAVQYIIGQLSSPVEQLMMFIYSLQDVKISLERINEIHRGSDEEDATGREERFPDGTPLSITVERMDFKYDMHALTKTLDGITMEIPAGCVTAVVGASGSGKTTLIKLLLGYYPAGSGTIAVAGRPLGDYSLRWWRRQCGVVMQDGVIFSESIARNIAVDDGEIDITRLERAARIANIHDYIMSLPLRYDTVIGPDGSGISQGQRQRILIARAVYREPQFIFLDEATNSLDAENERTIVENLDDFYRGRTVVVVAHRLSTVRNAHRIVVLDHGRIVETGSHAELIARRGTYYNLVKNQLELGT